MEQEPTKKTFKQYLFFLFGQQFSLLGSIVVYFVITWWVTVETGSAVYLAIMSFLFFVPQIIVTPIAGVLSDKLDRKKILILIDGFQAFVTFFLFLIFFLKISNVWLIITINTLRSTLQAIHLPTVNAITPTMVPKEKLSRINGINYLMMIVGPILAGFLLEIIPVANLILLDIFTFFIALIPLLFVKIPFVSEKSIKKVKKTFIKDFKEGFKIVYAIPGLLSLMLYAMLANFFTRPFMVLIPYFVKFVHFGDPLSYALVMTFSQIGSISGALISSLKKNWKHKVAMMMILTIIFFIAYGSVILAPTGNFLFIGICVLVAFSTFPINWAIYMTILQTGVPKDKIGRVVSIDHMISMAITPIGAILSGPLAELMGISNLYLASALLGITATIIIWFFTKIRSLDQKELLIIEEIQKTKEELIIE
ncbi:MAG: MFS transporter [Promethearchaeota archaeon]